MDVFFPPRIFLLSPARLDGKRAHLLFHPATMFPVARALQSTAGAPIGDLHLSVRPVFRGKLAYAEAFARPPQGLKSGVFVITLTGASRTLHTLNIKSTNVRKITLRPLRCLRSMSQQ